MGRMNIYLEPAEDNKLERLKKKFNISSKEEVIKRLIKQFPEKDSDFDFDIEGEAGIGIL